MNPKIILSPKNGPHAYYVVDAAGNTVNYSIREALVKLAYEKGDLIEFDTETQKARRIANHMETGAPEPQNDNMPVTETDPVLAFIHNEAVQTKPKELIIKDLKWKYLIRSVIRGKNIMMTGPAGAGKSVTAKHVANALQREFFYFNLGATQDPRATLIGNVHFDKNSGTYFAESQFIKAIQTENSVILLDELSRAHPEAWNILMTVLDEGQRYLRLDEDVNSPTIQVAENVSFIATANIGTEYTSTRVLDRALMDRFEIIEVDILSKEQEINLLCKRFPAVKGGMIEAVADIADATRKEWRSEEGKLSTMISTRMTVRICELLADGFSLTEASEVAILPFFDASGGTDSERTFVKQIIQKHMATEMKDIFNTGNDSGETIPF
jgi:nitric oxide reductase NorQ protein